MINARDFGGGCARGTALLEPTGSIRRGHDFLTQLLGRSRLRGPAWLPTMPGQAPLQVAPRPRPPQAAVRRPTERPPARIPDAVSRHRTHHPHRHHRRGLHPDRPRQHRGSPEQPLRRLQPRLPPRRPIPPPRRRNFYARRPRLAALARAPSPTVRAGPRGRAIPPNPARRRTARCHCTRGKGSR